MAEYSAFKLNRRERNEKSVLARIPVLGRGIVSKFERLAITGFSPRIDRYSTVDNFAITGTKNGDPLFALTAEERGGKDPYLILIPILIARIRENDQRQDLGLFPPLSYQTRNRRSDKFKTGDEKNWGKVGHCRENVGYKQRALVMERERLIMIPSTNEQLKGN